MRLPEAAFYADMVRVKQAVEAAMYRTTEPTQPPPPPIQRPPIIDVVDALENLIEGSGPRISFRVVTLRQPLIEKLAELEACLRADGKPLALCQPIHGLINGSKSLWGGRVLLCEEDFYAATTRFKKDLIALMYPDRQNKILPPDPTCMKLITQLEELENLVEQGRFRFFGSVSVPRDECLRHVDSICASLRVVEALLPAPQSPGP